MLRHALQNMIFQSQLAKPRFDNKPFLNAALLDEMFRPSQGDVSWCMLFADDIILVDETA